ncbi:MAG: membrane protein insertion efficiency factor YidD [Proteobacteria bacterium]|nr:membrane protein insertion efficiency factor YidD [Pseudomonadota bacterium]
MEILSLGFVVRRRITSIITAILHGLLKIYRYGISPALVCLFGASCRYTPSCSCYAEECLRKYPLKRALIKSTRRLLKCHPFTRGGVDLP